MAKFMHMIGWGVTRSVNITSVTKVSYTFLSKPLLIINHYSRKFVWDNNSKSFFYLFSFLHQVNLNKSSTIVNICRWHTLTSYKFRISYQNLMLYKDPEHMCNKFFTYLLTGLLTGLQSSTHATKISLLLQVYKTAPTTCELEISERRLWSLSWSFVNLISASSL